MDNLRRWDLAKEFGWTLAYIDTLSMGDLDEYEERKQVLDGIAKGNAFLRAHK